MLHGTPSAAFTALGITFPGLLLQDSWRYSFFALGRGSQAFLNDLIWGLTMVPGLIFLREIGQTSVFWVVFVWGATAGIAALIGPLQAKVLPNIAEGMRWIARHRDIGFRFLAEGAVSNAGGQLRGYGVGLFLGLAAVGYIQAVGTLIGPMTIMFQAMSLVLIPEAARVLSRTPARLGLFCVVVSAALAVVAVAWARCCSMLLPHGLGQLADRRDLEGRVPVVLPTDGRRARRGGRALGGYAGLHALGAAQRSLKVSIFGTVAFVGLSVGARAHLAHRHGHDLGNRRGRLDFLRADVAALLQGAGGGERRPGVAGRGDRPAAPRRTAPQSASRGGQPLTASLRTRSPRFTA